ncbi:MAG: hypothetical protein WBL45_11075, partial [Solirubrobacterales bacterium]
AKQSSGAQREATEKTPLKPDTLSRGQLIEQGDAICTESQDTYRTYLDRFPSGEGEPDVIYSRLLVGISSKAINRFNALRPPPSLEKPFDEYVKAQEQVGQWDRDALRAAEAEDTTAYLTAREDRDSTAEERRQLAEDVGFRECSGSEL